jgi:uncharacterized RDD family membrane protein YckC
VLRPPLHPPPLTFIFAAMTNGLMYCNRCGAQNSALAKFCSNCGTPFTADTASLPATPAGVTPSPQGPPQPPIAPPAQYIPPVAPPAYAMPVSGVRYGGFWIRVVAAIIDGLLLGIVVWPVLGILGLSIGLAGSQVSMPEIGVHLVRGIVAWVLFMGAGWLYEATLESSSKQATVGKMALGLKVTDEFGNRISFARASARYFSKILSRVILMIGYIMVGFTQRKQGLHDMIAGTLVVRTM